MNRALTTTVVASAACLHEPTPPSAQGTSPAPARWADEVVLYVPGEDVGEECALTNLDLALDCANEAASGEADSRGLGLGRGGILRLWFASGPVLDVPGDDLLVHGEAGSANDMFIEASPDGLDFEALGTSADPGGAGIRADLGTGDVRDAAFVQVTNTGTDAVAVDAVESLAALVLP